MCGSAGIVMLADRISGFHTKIVFRIVVGEDAIIIIIVICN